MKKNKPGFQHSARLALAAKNQSWSRSTVVAIKPHGTMSAHDTSLAFLPICGVVPCGLVSFKSLSDS